MKRSYIKWCVKTIAALTFVSVILQSCLKDNFDFDKLASTEWNPDVAIPLVYASLGVYDILARTENSDLIVIDPTNGLMALVYQGELFSFNASQIIELPDQSLARSIQLTSAEVTSFTTSGTVTKQDDFVRSYTLVAGIKIDSMALKSGMVNFLINSDFMHSGSINIKIPSFIKNGVSFNVTVPINYTGSPVNINQAYDVTGYSLDMTNGGTSFNQIPVEYTLTLSYTSSNPVTSANQISIEQTFANWQFSKVFGDFGQQTISVDRDSVDIKLFTNSLGGYFELVNPKLKFLITNSFGFPVDVEFTTLESVNQNTGAVTPILLPGFPNPFAINYPSISQIGDSVTTSLTIDKTNSNIVSVITPTPKFLVHEIKAVSNPSGSSSTTNFLTDNSKFGIKSELELPMEGFAYGFNIIDTLPFEFGENIQEIESILLRIIMTNGFPINVRMQLYFTDENYNLLDSLMDLSNNSIMLSGQINSDGRVVLPTQKITDIPYSQNRMPALLNAKYVIVKGESESFKGNITPPTIVKIYDNYKLDVRLGLKIQGKFKI